MILRHKQLVFNDVEFQSLVGKLTPIKAKNNTVIAGLDEREELAESFGISRTDVLDYETGNINTNYDLEYETKHNVFTAILDANITQNDLKELYRSIEKLRDKHKIKRGVIKPINYDDLFYAVLKGLNKGLTFKEVYKALDNSTYSYYKKKLPPTFVYEHDLRKRFVERYESVK